MERMVTIEVVMVVITLVVAAVAAQDQVGEDLHQEGVLLVLL